MKKMMIVLSLVSGGLVSAQSTSREIETYERWENGELVEERSSAKENGEPIENFDFDAWKREHQLSSNSSASSIDFDAKKQEMQQRMNELQAKSEAMFAKKQAEMEVKMQEFQKRAEKMQADMKQRMDAKMKESEQKKELQSNPAPVKPSIQSKPTVIKTVRT